MSARGKTSLATRLTAKSKPSPQNFETLLRVAFEHAKKIQALTPNKSALKPPHR
jgi:hypothetical protein